MLQLKLKMNRENKAVNFLMIITPTKLTVAQIFP